MTSSLLHASRLYAANGSTSRQVKFLLRSATHWTTAARWLGFLQAQPELAAAMASQRQWLHKLQRPYLCKAFGAQRKLMALQDHFSLFLRRFPSQLRQTLLTESKVEIARVVGKSGAAYRVMLSLTHTMDKEGELMLSLLAEEGDDRLTTLAFSFVRSESGRYEAVLGCLQGPASRDGRERFREMTKDLHGLMPKALMMRALYALCRKVGVLDVLAVSNAGHVHNSRWRRYHAISADYDAFWESLGGAPANDFFWRLSAFAPQRDLADVPSRKRAQYQRRQKLETELEDSVSAFWQGCAGEGAQVRSSLAEEAHAAATVISPVVA